MKLVYLAFALICIQGSSAADGPTPALNMLRRDPMVTFADEDTARYAPTTVVDNQERTSIRHWDDHHHHRDHHWDPDHHLDDLWQGSSSISPIWQEGTPTYPDTVNKWLEQGRSVYVYHGPNGPEYDLKPERKKFDYDCTFESGEGIGGSAEMIGSQTGQTCARACAERWENDHSINGVTVFKNGKGGCWCKKNITSISGSSKDKKTCLLDTTTILEEGLLIEPGYHPGYHLAPTQAPTNDMLRRDPMVTYADEGTARYDLHPPTPTAVNQERTSIHHWDDHHHHRDHHWDPDHHLDDLWQGSSSLDPWWQKTTAYPDTVHKWLEQGRSVYWYHGDNGPEYDLKPIRKKVEYECLFESGDGNGGSEEMIGSQTGDACAHACIERRKKDYSVNGVTVFKNGKEGCWCKRKMTGISGSSTYKKTCFLHDAVVIEEGRLIQPQGIQATSRYEPHGPETTMTHPTATQAPVNDYSYMNYKNRQCRDIDWWAKGCFKTRRPFKRGKLLIYWRHDIEWAADRIGSFASSLACACAEKAREQGIKFFGLHFWGECWALDEKDMVGDPEGDCTLADGTYKTKCIGYYNKDWGHTCLGGSRSYFLHVVFRNHP